VDIQGRCIFESSSGIGMNRFLKKVSEALAATNRYRCTMKLKSKPMDSYSIISAPGAEIKKEESDGYI
jgi:hypothetical protein